MKNTINNTYFNFTNNINFDTTKVKLQNLLNKWLNDIKYHNIDSIKIIINNTYDNQLKILDLSSLGLTSLPPNELLELLNIEHFNFNCNKIINLDHKFTNLPKIKSLSFIGCNIKHIANDVFSQLYQLESLNLAVNELDSLDFIKNNQFTNLLELKLNSNQIKILSENQFSNLINLLELDLSSNPITEIYNYTFKNLFNLNIINFRHINNIKIHEYAFTDLHSLDTIHHKKLSKQLNSYRGFKDLITRLIKLYDKNTNITIANELDDKYEQYKQLTEYITNMICDIEKKDNYYTAKDKYRKIIKFIIKLNTNYLMRNLCLDMVTISPDNLENIIWNNIQLSEENNYLNNNSVNNSKISLQIYNPKRFIITRI